MTTEELSQILTSYKATYGLTDEFLHYIALCGLFHPRRNIVKNWDANEELFLELVKNSGKQGLNKFFQSVILYFIRTYKDDMRVYGATFIKKIIDNNIISAEWILLWADKKVELDPASDSNLYDHKAEKKFRKDLTDFTEWLKKAEEEEADEAAEPDSETKDDDDQITDKPAAWTKTQTELAKKQAEVIEKQRKQ